jgi:hypothetical protein
MQIHLSELRELHAEMESARTAAKQASELLMYALSSYLRGEGQGPTSDEMLAVQAANAREEATLSAYLVCLYALAGGRHADS